MVQKWIKENSVTCNGESPDAGFTPVTEHPMIRPCLRTPRYHLGPILLSFTSLNPAFSNHSIYSSSFGNSIHTSAKKRDNQKVGYTGPIKHAFPPSFNTRYASLIPLWGSGQYSMLGKGNIKMKLISWRMLLLLFSMDNQKNEKRVCFLKVYIK